MKLVRKFIKTADFQKSTYELAQWLGNKRKNAHKRRFTFDGDPSEIRTRVTAVKGRCPRPLDDRVLKRLPYLYTILILFASLFSKITVFFKNNHLEAPVNKPYFSLVLFPKYVKSNRIFP